MNLSTAGLTIDLLLRLMFHTVPRCLTAHPASFTLLEPLTFSPVCPYSCKVVGSCRCTATLPRTAMRASKSHSADMASSFRTWLDLNPDVELCFCHFSHSSSSIGSTMDTQTSQPGSQFCSDATVSSGATGALAPSSGHGQLQEMYRAQIKQTYCTRQTAREGASYWNSLPWWSHIQVSISLIHSPSCDDTFLLFASLPRPSRWRTTPHSREQYHHAYAVGRPCRAVV